MGRANGPRPLTTIREEARTMAAEDCTSKTCAKCGQIKPSSEYCSHKATRDRLQPWCRRCFAVYRKEYKKNNLEKIKVTARNWVVKNRDRVNKLARENRKKNRDRERLKAARYAERQAKWVAKNRNRVNASLSRWKKRNQDKVRLDARERKAVRLAAVPGWANKTKMLDVYRAAVESGLTVDHIVPLRSDVVCGLHWEGNLQLLTVSENSTKNNKRWPDMP